MTPAYLYEAHRALAGAVGAPWFTGRYNLNLLAIRAASPSDTELFDDALVVSYLAPHTDAAGRPTPGTRTVFTAPATTDPGRPYRLEPMRPEGCVVLTPQHAPGSHARGLHKGRPALVQVGPLKAWRDNDRDGDLDRTGPVYTLDPSCRVNIHDAPGEKDGKVGRQSAGCIVTRHTRDLGTLYSLVGCQQTAGYGASVSLTLVDLHPDGGLTPEAAEAALAILNHTHGRTTPAGA